MDYLQAILLGAVQGIAEWLPVSSQGVVTLVNKLIFKTPYQEAVSTAVWLHTGTLLASLIYFRDEIKKIIISAFSEKADKQLVRFLAISTAATFPIAFLLLRVIIRLEPPDNVLTVMIGVLLLGVYLTRRLSTEFQNRQRYLSSRAAVITGFIQGLAAIPGVSRSGVTITALLYQGADLREALKISYLMSIPVTAGAQLFLPIAGGTLSINPVGVFSLVSATVVGYFTIRFLIKFSEKTDLMKGTLILGVVVILVGIFLTLV